MTAIGLLLAGSTLHTFATPDEWEFTELTLGDAFPDLVIFVPVPAKNGSMACLAVDKVSLRKQSLLFRPSANDPFVLVANTTDELPGGMGRPFAFSANHIKVDPLGRVLFSTDLMTLDNDGFEVPESVTLRWDGGSFTRMLPLDDKNVFPSVIYDQRVYPMSSDGRWIAEVTRKGLLNNPVLTDGVNAVEVDIAFSPECFDGRGEAVANANGDVFYYRTNNWCEGSTTLGWSFVRAGSNPGVMLSGEKLIVDEFDQSATGTEITNFARDALFNDDGDILFMRDVYTGQPFPDSRELVKFSAATHTEQVLTVSTPFNVDNKVVLSSSLLFDKEGRVAFSTMNNSTSEIAAIYAGPNLETDRVIGVGDALFDSVVSQASAMGVWGPGSSPNDERIFMIRYVLEDGRNGYAVASHGGPEASDRDGDGLLDSWETEGGGIDVNDDGTIDLDLFALGARPDHKDLFVEVDSTPMARPLHPNALPMVVDAFAKAPVENPDRTTGIRLHLQIDETDVRPEFGVTVFNKLPFGFRERTKPAHFGTSRERDSSNENHLPILAAKRRAFRYCMFYDFIDFGDQSAYLGIAEIAGNDMIVHLGERTFRDGYRDAEDQAATFMHELGHTLGLRHGGGIDEVIVFEGKSWQGKPNYPSIMNYALAHPYRWSKAFWKLDYCREALLDLNESSLDESAGIPSMLYRNYRMPFGVGPASKRTMRLAPLNGRPIDYNNNDRFTSGIGADLNFIGAAATFSGVDRPSPAEIMKGHDDWANLQYAVVDKDGELDGDVALAEGCPTQEIHAFLEASVPVIADTYEEWIASFTEFGPGAIALTRTGFDDDPDADGVPNGIERYLGTSPASPSPGLEPVSGAANGSFRHPRSPDPDTTLVASYEWSTDLRIWHASGESAGGLSVTMQPVVTENAEGLTDTVEVTPEITGFTTSTLFFRLRVQAKEG